MLATDPRDFLLDPVTHDVIITDDLQWSRGLAGVAQDIKIALLMIRGEWFADLDDGVPYLERTGVTADQALLGGRFNQERALTAFRAAILGVSDVVEILALTVVLDTRTRVLRVTWSVRTTFGDTVPDTLEKGIN